VDDTLSVLEGRQVLLEENGYEVLTATGGKEASRLPHPEINGDTATRHMKAHKPDVPIALLLGDEWPPPSALEAADAVVTAERRAGKNLAPAAIKSERTFLVACVNIGCDRTGGPTRKIFCTPCNTGRIVSGLA